MASEARAGVIAMVAVCGIWGLSPVYYGLLADVPPIEVLCHRAVWAALLFVGVLWARGRLGTLRAVLADRRQLWPIGAASLAISLNWYLFILATAIDRVSESSLGYYLFPLMSVAAGRLVFAERLSSSQWAAVLLASFAVALLGWGLGEMPLIALGLAASMTAYGIMKRFISASPVTGVAAETLWISPFALAWLIVWGSTSYDVETWLLLAGAGPLTAVPLILFAYAAQRISMSTQGFVMYLNPTLQAFVAVAVFAEAITGWHALAFPLIWLALGLYSVELVRAERRARKSTIKPSGPSTTVM